MPRVHRLGQLAAYFVAAVVATAVGSLVVALVLDYDPVQTIAFGLMIVGGAFAALAALTAAGPTTPPMAGSEQEYLRYVHHRDAAERRAWQDENLLLVLAGTALAAVGLAVALLS